MAPALPAREMACEAFLRWDGENRHVEGVDGELVGMAPVTGGHDERRDRAPLPGILPEWGPI